MLISLKIQHLAVVEDIELQFYSGMTSLTGETGAGKSILVDALGLVLGDRADSRMIRSGHERAEISAEFNTAENPALQAWLVSQDLDEEAHCLLRRTINTDGRSRAYINGRSVPVSQLKEVGKYTIDIHGQHAHQSLLRPETQRQLLDTVAKNQSLLDQLAAAYREWQLLQQKLTETQKRYQEKSARRELLQYQVTELASLELSDEYIQTLLQEQQQLSHASQLMQAAESGIYQLYEQEHGAASAIITSVLTALEKLQDIEPRFANTVELLNSVTIQLDECANDLRHYLDSLELDPSRLEQVEQQLSLLHSLARKHQIEIEDLPAHYQKLCDELALLSNLDIESEQLEQALQQRESHCRDLCAQIHHRRKKTASTLAKKISLSIQQLAIPHGKIEFMITPMENGKFNESGADQIQILVSTNPGQATDKLAKVASGGELARISLAIQVVTAGTKSVPTLVFDEVDVGIGGGVAEIVGQHLRKLASTQQVICITHLPQVAVQAHQQLHVKKYQSGNSTEIEVNILDKKQRIEEIARMLGGVRLTEKTRLHAEEMLNQANQ